MPKEKISVTGLPIRLLFTQPPEPKPVVRARLGLKPDKPVVLMMGGGQGLGRVYEIAEAIGHSGLDAQLIVIAGRKVLTFKPSQILKKNLNPASS